MSILGKLVSFIPGIGPVAEMGVDALSGVLGGASKAGAQSNQNRDSLKLLLENAKLNREKYALAAPGTRLGTSTRASLTANYKPSTVDWGPGGFQPGMGAKGVIPKFRGGLSEGMANLSPDTKRLADQITHDELIAQIRGGETAGGGDQGNHLISPDGYGTDKAMPTDIGKESTGDKLLGGAATITSILGALSKFKRGYTDPGEMSFGGTDGD